MTDKSKRLTGPLWAAYTPSKETPWNPRRVVHLHRRAGFAATWSEIQRDLKDGPGPSIDRLLSAQSRMQGVPAEFEQTAGLLLDTAADTGRLKAWWVYRMFFGPDPLGERLTLMWHNHFATSAAKVKDLGVMRQQNELFRRHSRKPFGELLDAVVRDPAILIWLDAGANRKEHPNENLARELMELFTLGIGHYTEKDVKEGARALTGWTVAEGKFREDAAQHDEGDKIILRRKGPWKGTDFVRFVLEEPATSERLAWRLCELLMGENAVDAVAIRSLASGLRDHQLDIGWGVETILRSAAFSADRNLGNRILGPVEYVVGAARSLEMFDAPPGTLLLADWAARLGQDLFYPPNVGGWNGGRSWISTQAMIGRANFAMALVEGALSRRGEALNALALAKRHGHGEGLEDVLALIASACIRRWPGPASCSIAAGWQSCRASAIPIPIAHTSRAWRSGKRRASISSSATGWDGSVADSMKVRQKRAGCRAPFSSAADRCRPPCKSYPPPYWLSWTTWQRRRLRSASRCWFSVSLAAPWPRTPRREPIMAQPRRCSLPVQVLKPA
jgi:hypothetical protein